MNEHKIQNHAVKALRKIGFTCIITSNRRRTSNTKGTPDVYVYVGLGSWIALEFKQPKGKLTVEQIALNETGSIYIVDSVDTAVKICLEKKSLANYELARTNSPPYRKQPRKENPSCVN